MFFKIYFLYLHAEESAITGVYCRKKVIYKYCLSWTTHVFPHLFHLDRFRLQMFLYIFYIQAQQHWCPASSFDLFLDLRTPYLSFSFWTYGGNWFIHCSLTGSHSGHSQKQLAAVGEWMESEWGASRIMCRGKKCIHIGIKTESRPVFFELHR